MFLLHPDIFGWDLAILLMMTLGLSGAVTCMLWVRHHRHRGIIQRCIVSLLGFFGLFGFLLVTYGSFIEPQMIVTTTHTVPLPLNQELRIAVIADMHVGPYKGARFVERLVDHTNALHPDIVLLAGDFLFLDNSDPAHLAPLEGLQAQYGKYAVIGNHDTANFATVLLRHRYSGVDRTEELENALTLMSITVLRNEHSTLRVGEQFLSIAGVDDYWAGRSDVPDALAGISMDEATILLAHTPDVMIDPESRRAHLIVAGHTHGGQFRLPFIGPITPIPTQLGNRYDQGIFPVDEDTNLAITRGAGESLARARLFAWPEVMLLTTRVSEK